MSELRRSAIEIFGCVVLDIAKYSCLCKNLSLVRSYPNFLVSNCPIALFIVIVKQKRIGIYISWNLVSENLLSLEDGLFLEIQIICSDLWLIHLEEK